MSNILDSSLISPTLKKYNYKLIECGDFVQLYIYSTDKKKIIDDDFNRNLKNIKRSLVLRNEKSFNNRSSNTNDFKTLKQISLKNINRSKNSCQLLAKCNMNHWTTFITLTYACNITDIELSRNHFRHFIDNVRRVYKDFMYLCVTEFQKRGAIHYHLLTNISLDNNNLIYFQKTDNKTFPHIKYWNYGFNSVEVINKDYKKVIGYISKYMTKDIDNRLWCKRRYTYSLNLQHPVINYLEFGNKIDDFYYVKKLTTDYTLCYDNIYLEKCTNEPIYFFELLKNK